MNLINSYLEKVECTKDAFLRVAFSRAEGSIRNIVMFVGLTNMTCESMENGIERCLEAV